jgi:hypothetical protein
MQTCRPPRFFQSSSLSAVSKSCEAGLIEKEGRLSKVNHPSPFQVSNDIPGPEPSRIQREIKPAS